MLNEARGEMELKIGEKTYTVRPSLHLISTLENEFGSLLQLAIKFETNDWKVETLIQFVHHLLKASADKDIPKFAKLAEIIMDEGPLPYAAQVYQFIMETVCKAPMGEEQAQTASA